VSIQRLGVVKMVAVAVGAFAFTFSLVPLYRIACEKVFGIRLDNTAVDAARYGAADVGARMVTVEFDGGVNSKLPWAFKPHQTRMRVRLGEQYETNYSAHNNSARVVVGSATPSVAPARASGYFSKTECFCFTAQTLDAGETRDLPVRFIIDPALPADVNTITLSYTFFRNDVLTERALTAAASAAAAPAGVPHSAP
jgi:cytochrome c oxidase assembly protein subunit 11